MPKNNSSETVDFNKARKQAAAKKIFKKLRIPIAILLIIAIALIALAAVGDTRRSNVMDSFRSVPSTIGSSPGYPYNEDELSLSKVLLIGDKPLIITENGLKVLSQEADELNDLRLEWADTKAVSFNGRAFIFSNTSGKAYLISRTKTLASFNESGTIVTAEVAKNGSVAFSSTTDTVQSVVSVFSPRQKLVFRLNCDRDYVSSLSLSPGGRRLLTASVNAENAELYSTVSLYSTSKTEPKFETKLSGTAIIKVIYASANKFIAIGDNRAVVLNSDGEIVNEIKYSDDALYSVGRDKNGAALLAYKEFGGSKIKLVNIPATGKKLNEFELDYSPASIDFRDRKIACAVDNTVTVYSVRGNEKETYECEDTVSSVLIQSTGVYTLETGSVRKY